MHGLTEGGNEPFLLVYNPALQPTPKKKIDIVDVAATLSSYIYDIDLPQNAIGYSRRTFPDDSKNTTEIKFWKKSLHQLNSALKRRGFSTPGSDVDQLLHLPDDKFDEENFERLQSLTKHLKGKMYNVIETFWTTSFFTLGVTLIFASFLYFRYNTTIDYLLAAGELKQYFIEHLLLAGAYTPVLLQLMLLWWSWGGRHNSGLHWKFSTFVLV